MQCLLLFILLLWAAPLWAQTPLPDDLLVPAQPAQENASAPPYEAIAVPGPAPAPLAPSIVTAPAASHPPALIGAPVSAAGLPPPSPAGDGLLDSQNGGLAPDLWQSSAAASVTPLLQEAGIAITRGSLREKALRDLARRLALTRAAPPMGAPAEAAGFFAARVLLAASSGDIDGAYALLRHHPEFLDEPGAERLASIALMQGDLDKACADPHLPLQNLNFWQKLSVLCALRDEGGRARAQLTLDVMREAGESDTLFLNLAEAAASGKKDVKDKPQALPALHVALLVVGGIRPNAAMLALLEQNSYPLLLQLKAPEEWLAKIRSTLNEQESAADSPARQAAKGTLANPEEALALYARDTAVPLEKRADALALLKALGVAPGPKALAALLAQGTSLPVASRDPALAMSLKEGRKGEALLQILLLAPGEAISIRLLQVETLHALGLDQEALELAGPLL